MEILIVILLVLIWLAVCGVNNTLQELNKLMSRWYAETPADR